MVESVWGSNAPKQGRGFDSRRECLNYYSPPTQSDDTLWAMSYLTTPYMVYNGVATIQRLAGILSRANLTNNTRAVRHFVIGDSRRTPTGQGNKLWSYLMFEYWKRFVNMPETGIINPLSFGGDGTTVGSGYGMLGGGSFGGVPTTRTATYSPYACEGATSAFKDLSTFPALYGIHHDMFCDNSDPADIPRSNEYLTRIGMKGEFFIDQLNGVSPNANFNSLTWQMTEQSTSVPDYFGTQTATGTIDISSAVGAEGPVRSFLTPAWTWNTAPASGNRNSLYGCLIAGSTSTTQRVDIMAAIIRSANTRGIGLHFFGKAGTLASDLLSGADPRPNCYNLLNAMQCDIAQFAWGVNDASAATATATYKANTLANVNWGLTHLLDQSGNTPLIILESDPDIALTGNAPGRAVFDLYADQAASIAAATPGVLFINSRRILEEQDGWKEGVNLGTLTIDGTHESSLGAKTHALRFANTIFGAASSVSSGARNGGHATLSVGRIAGHRLTTLKKLTCH